MPDPSTRMHVYVAINEERDYQDKKHADDKHSVSEWLTIMGSYANKANEAFAKGGDKCLETMLDCMRKITASGVACMEQNGIVSRDDGPQPVCDVCGDTEEQHKTQTGYDHGFMGAFLEWPSEEAEAKSRIEAMVDVFLAWPLPSTVCPDRCVLDRDYPHRIGTNLLTATEAKQMFEYVLARVQESETIRRADLIKKLNAEFTPAGDAALSALAAARQSMQSDLRKSVEGTLNKFSAENGSNTPDFILAQYLIDCLGAYDKAVMAREKWYGREPKPAPPDVVGKPFLSSI